MSTQRGNKNSDAIRILQRDRDASARATHLKAEIGMVPNSTIERKIMSTKTSIKRIALVAAAALTLGGFSAVSANAAYTQISATPADAPTQAIGQDAATGDGGIGGVAGPANSLVVNIQQKTDSPTTTTYGAYIVISGGTISSALRGTLATSAGETGTASSQVADTGTVIAANGLSAVFPGGDTSTAGIATYAGLPAGFIRSIRINTPAAGTLTISVYNATTKGANPSAYNSTPDLTKTITVSAAGVSGTVSAALSTVYDSTTTSTTANANMSSVLVSANAGGSSAQVRYDAAFLDANGVNLSTSKPTATWSVTLTGPGSLLAAGASGLSGTTAGARVLTGTGGSPAVLLFGDGTSGTSTLTFSSGSTVIATKTVVFYSTTVKSLSATVLNKYVGIPVTGYTEPRSATSTGSNDTYISVTAKDATGNSVPSASLTATSSDATVVTAGTVVYDSTDLTYYVNLTGVARGKATITIKDSTGLITTTADVQVVKAVADKVVFSTNNASYSAGEKVKVQLTATTSDSEPIADGTYAGLIKDTMTTTIALGSGSLFGTSGNNPSFQNGVASISVYAPMFSGTIGVSYYLGSAKTLMSTALQAVAAAGTEQTGSIVINGQGDSSSLAYDAASAATDAANNAYEEAQNATQAASDALAAVKALAVQVKALIALVNKIKAKLKA